MKEIEGKLASEDRIEIITEQQQKKEIKLIDNQRKIRGLILWEFNHKTRELKEAEYQKENVKITSLAMKATSITKHNKVVIKENSEYFQALNRKNAIKHLKKKRIIIN